MKRLSLNFVLFSLVGLVLPALLSAGPAQNSAASKAAAIQDMTALKAMGSHEAPITIEVFSDYQCPYCTQWHDSTYKPLMAAYPGKIRLIYRNYPLPFHQNAYMSAEAALCANDQNAYWQYHDALFANNDQLNNQAGTVVDNSFYVNLAGTLGMDTTTFSTCLSTQKYKQAVQSDLDYANSLPPDSDGSAAVSGTPTFFINGYRVVGAEPLAYFQQIIDAQLKTQ